MNEIGNHGRRAVLKTLGALGAPAIGRVGSARHPRGPAARFVQYPGAVNGATNFNNRSTTMTSKDL